ncbi:pentapeptide repeat-containing protein (plasmid) [Rhizobium ruizarguesonis]|uniref:pentapeptide repeat-containing protein n=1 Tax=Rhizobium ruizarguesonis TaxID=2081791 RepID=UPI001031D780|nr:pentapeptide repeat-containing protein [Rhizobium ruizarguesonis]TAW06630.1 pentapeptide repeat-containing protein [Rhizobium ruizarguesonis]
MVDVEALEQRITEDRRKTELELLRREHRIVNATIALAQNWKGDKEFRWASFEGFVRCLFAMVFRTGVGASVTAIGLAGLFFAYQANRLLQEQTIRINIQSHLTEAQRRSSLIIELGQIMEDISKEKAAYPTSPTSKRQVMYRTDLESIANSGQFSDQMIQDYIRSQFTPSDALVGRIAALANSLKPYYYVSYGRGSATQKPKQLSGMAGFLDDLASLTLQVENEYYPRLIDEPVSPERGQLLRYMLSAGVNLLPVDNAGATFEAADLQESQLYGFFLPASNLRNAKFKSSVFSTMRFGSVNPNLGVQFNGADFTCAAFLNTTFSSSVLRGAKFAFVRMKGFNFIHGPEYSFPSTIYEEADFTDADFDGVEVSQEDFPFAFKLPGTDVAEPPPQYLRGFNRDEWLTEKKEGDASVNRDVPELERYVLRRKKDSAADYAARRQMTCLPEDAKPEVSSDVVATE